MPPETTRRKLLAYTGAVGAGGLAAGGGAVAAVTRSSSGNPGSQQLPFYGTHQPGIDAPVQAQGWLTAFDLKPGTTVAQVRALMREWTSIAATTMAGSPLPSGDDAMAYGRNPGALTVTVGVGASLLTKLGLGRQIPEALTPLPTFLGDAIEPNDSDGDLAVLVAANDGLVAVHALRAMQRSAASVVTQRWQINGFGEAGGVMPSPTATPRNLMGQLDGTGNPKTGTAAFDATVYVPANDGSPEWMRGGSYMVYRRIRMLLNEWDGLDRREQEAVIGRDKVTGAPLSGGTEFTAPDYQKFSSSGQLLIPPGSHIRQASAEFNSGATIYRRPFSYYNGQRADGSPDAGLMFLAFQQNPATGFTVIQQRLAGADSLSTFIRHEASGLFAILPGCAKEGDYLGQALLG